MKNKKFILFVLIPIFMHVLIFNVGPILAGFGISMMDYNPLRDSNSFVGLNNFKQLMNDKVLLKALVNTLTFVGVTVVLNIVFSLMIAQFISMFKSNKIRSFFRMAFFLPCVAPLVASSVVWSRSIYPTVTGLANMILKVVGVNPVNWLGDPSVLMWSIIVFTIWVDIGYNIILFSAGIDAIPTNFYEAAEMDGASSWHKFRHITLPLLGRTMTFVIIMTLISHFQMFAQFSVMVLKSGPQNSGLVLTSYIYKIAFELKDMGYASAVAVLLFVIIFIITIIQQKIQKVDWDY
ncbi:MAG TPA: sugar ABC transporter permease [Erysipelotrichaceae bacterium]|nr:sugar ABC transporter permease [Erysipelotrichaceae bacterium]